MSWQCPICETVNQDVTPICTVCDNLAPVIESYLSIENIRLMSEYNKKLDYIHTLEAAREYEAMLNAAIEAIPLYKENGLAVEKAKHALSHLNKVKLKETITSLLNSSIEKGNYTYAYSLLEIAKSFSIDDTDLISIISEVSSLLARKDVIDRILYAAYHAMIELDITSAIQIIEEGLRKYPMSESLQIRRDDIKKMSEALKTKNIGNEIKQHDDFFDPVSKKRSKTKSNKRTNNNDFNF